MTTCRIKRDAAPHLTSTASWRRRVAGVIDRLDCSEESQAALSSTQSASSRTRLLTDGRRRCVGARQKPTVGVVSAPPMPIPPPNSRQMLWCRPRCRNEPIVINCLRQCEQPAGRRYHVTNAMAASGPSMSHALRYALAMGLVYSAISLSGCGDAEPAPRRTTLTFATGRRGSTCRRCW